MLRDGRGRGRVDQTAPPVYFRGNFHNAVFLAKGNVSFILHNFLIYILKKDIIPNCKSSKMVDVGEALVMAGCAIPHQVEGRG